MTNSPQAAGNTTRRDLNFKSAHLLISSPRWGEEKGEGDFMDSTLTPTLSRQRERGIY